MSGVKPLSKQASAMPADGNGQEEGMKTPRSGRSFLGDEMTLSPKGPGEASLGLTRNVSTMEK